MQCKQASKKKRNKIESASESESFLLLKQNGEKRKCIPGNICLCSDTGNSTSHKGPQKVWKLSAQVCTQHFWTITVTDFKQQLPISSWPTVLPLFWNLLAQRKNKSTPILILVLLYLKLFHKVKIKWKQRKEKIPSSLIQLMRFRQHWAKQRKITGKKNNKQPNISLSHYLWSQRY